jgi:trehalose-phosphatase
MKTFSQLEYNRLVIVSYRLPFKFVKKGKQIRAVQNSGGLVSAILALSEKMNQNESKPSKILWVGEGESQTEKYNSDPRFELHPVTIPSALNDKYYGGFCNDTIWPLFHYFPSLAVYDQHYFKAYEEANTLFYEVLKGILKPGDFIWIHDYQLMLLPAMVRSGFPNVHIGFFLHIPFPSSEIFRLVPRTWREALLKGLTGADIIGFHTNDYTQHFIRSVKRTLGYECVQNIIHTGDHITKADAFPIGIDFDKFHGSSSSLPVLKEKKKLREQLAGNKLIFSVDRLDYAKGLLNRLIAYELFLERYSQWHQKVVFNMVVIPSRDQIERYREMKKEIEATVGRINGKYSNLSWRPIIYQYKSIPFHELVALYDISDVGLITPLRDGMNLVSKEYVACQKDNIGMLILSELAGAASELTESIIITPTDMDEISEAICKALEMPQKEKEQKILKMQERVKNYNVFTWANDFFNQAKEIKDIQKKMSVNFIEASSLAHIKATYQKAGSRVIFIDYDGTLIPFSTYPEQAVMNEKAQRVITILTDDEKNRVIIISGRNRDFLERQFKNAKVTLIAEHGFFTKEPGQDWITSLSVELDWKQKVIPILKEYVDRCNGSFMEEKFASLAWHYRNVDMDFASLRINELRDDLMEILKNNNNLQILEGNKVIEIKSMAYNKGTVASRILQEGRYGFAMAIGDDKTDEDLFRVMPSDAHTIKVGTGLSIARYNLRKQKQLYDLFQELTAG